LVLGVVIVVMYVSVWFRGGVVSVVVRRLVQWLILGNCVGRFRCLVGRFQWRAIATARRVVGGFGWRRVVSGFNWRRVVGGFDRWRIVRGFYRRRVVGWFRWRTISSRWSKISSCVGRVRDTV